MSAIKGILKKLMDFVPLKNKVILESNPDMADNTYYLYKKILEKGYNRKYKLIWLVNNPKEFNNINIKNVYFKEWEPKNPIKKLDNRWLLYTAKYVIVCNKYIEKRRKNQTVAALGHGTILKSVKQHKMIGKDCDFTLCPSEFFIPIYCDQLKLNRSQLVLSGYPRNDMLSVGGSISRLLRCNEDTKYIIWMPTFRKQKNSGRVDSSFSFPLGIPIIYNVQELKSINKFLKKCNIVMLLKLHPAQDTSVIRASSYSNFLILDDAALKEHGITLYEILSDTAALITDYSSIYYDYLLLHKPIGITLDDYQEYKECNGFSFSNILDILKGEYIYNIIDLERFISNVELGNDVMREEREKVNRMANKYQNGEYSQMVLDYLVKNKGF